MKVIFKKSGEIKNNTLIWDVILEDRTIAHLERIYNKGFSWQCAIDEKVLESIGEEACTSLSELTDDKVSSLKDQIRKVVAEGLPSEILAYINGSSTSLFQTPVTPTIRKEEGTSEEEEETEDPYSQTNGSFLLPSLPSEGTSRVTTLSAFKKEVSGTKDTYQSLVRATRVGAEFHSYVEGYLNALEYIIGRMDKIDSL